MSIKIQKKIVIFIMTTKRKMGKSFSWNLNTQNLDVYRPLVVHGLINRCMGYRPLAKMCYVLL